MGDKSKRPGTEIHQELRKIRRKRSRKSSGICWSSVIIQKRQIFTGCGTPHPVFSYLPKNINSSLCLFILCFTLGQKKTQQEGYHKHSCHCVSVEHISYHLRKSRKEVS